MTIQSGKVCVTQATELIAVVGSEFAPSEWRSVTQPEIDRFVELTGDRNWIHADAEHVVPELKGSLPVVPAQLLLALIPGLLQQAYTVSGLAHGRAAALRAVRFRHFVRVCEPFRLRTRLTLVEPRSSFVQVDTACDLELRSGLRALTSRRTDVFPVDRG